MDTRPFGSVPTCPLASRVKVFRRYQKQFQKPAIAKAIAGFLLKPNAPTVSGPNERTKMNTNRKLPARFGPETRFEVRPVPVVPFRATAETELERLKKRLLWD